MPTEAHLVADYQGSGRLALLGPRNYSAEFYTQGKIARLETPAKLAAWLRPGDGVLVPKYKYPDFAEVFGNIVKPVAEDREYFLFVPVPVSANRALKANAD